MRAITFGTFVPTGTKGQLAGIDSEVGRWEACRNTALVAESLGYDSVWVADHLHNAPVASNQTLFEAFTTLAALAEATTSVRLGSLVAVSAFRRPSLVAKIGATLDVISNGRFELGIGSGWYEGEHAAHGVPLLAAPERVAEMEEAVEIILRLWTESSVTFEGRFHSLRDAQSDPKPVQRPHPPIWIGGGGERLTLRAAARWASRVNFDLTEGPADWAHKRDVFLSHCDAVGRDPGEVELTWNADLVVREGEGEVQRAAAQATVRRGEQMEAWATNNLVGTPEQLVERLRRYVELGCSSFVVGATEPANEHLVSLRTFADRVIPRLR